MAAELSDDMFTFAECTLPGIPRLGRRSARPKPNPAACLLNPIVWFTMWMAAGLGWFGYSLASPGDGGATKRVVTASRVRYETVAIQDVKKGDLILARDEFGKSLGYKPVVETYQRVSDHLRVLTFEDESGTQQILKTTNEHPFWLVGSGKFVKAGEIEPGNKVTGPSGELQTLVATSYEPHPDGIPVFNFKVAGYHTYFVSENGSRSPPVLVHNANYPTAAKMGGRRSIALRKDIPGGGYKELAEQTGATRWQDWARDGITQRQVRKRFGRAYHQAADRASEIHFSLDGIDDVAGAVQAGKSGFVPGNMAHAELHYLYSNPDLLKKTIFYRRIDGVQQVVETPTLP